MKDIVHEPSSNVPENASPAADRMADAYTVIDRREDGYRGRWRYRVKAIWPGGRTEALALFRNRRVAAFYATRCAAFGEAAAYRMRGHEMAPASPAHRMPWAAGQSSTGKSEDGSSPQKDPTQEPKT